ncbi:aminodeoxychorismate/anthranilate synthase component II [Antarcticibacterium arcticum]|uniref:Aminodeoxychorismate/anthranilate synthase component II n=1 Tax=Antarcticibacterium arcticum TaxID=2585771 RepID=A0A5B8YEI9_9FLAO|nr:aminodeoxychorismate/anthranilate synthase component II [Antarcticibacterium arcticum]QED36310.1 aminodeoxychorismate/anthranilate synthase component II [Antarcticibacterium arcticum]
MKNSEKSIARLGKPVSVLVIDNYDSFVYNLVHYLEELNCEVSVRRNNEISLEDVAHYDKILLSPGPGIPEEAGLLKAIVKEYAANKSILGVCLGQQAIGEVFGGNLINLETVYHGVATKVTKNVNDESLFNGIENEFEVGRYHSWVVDKNLPACLEATSYDENGQVMSLRHREYDVRGVQFHPESVLTPNGKLMIKNWVFSGVNSEKPQPEKELFPDTKSEL